MHLWFSISSLWYFYVECVPGQSKADAPILLIQCVRYTQLPIKLEQSIFYLFSRNDCGNVVYPQSAINQGRSIKEIKRGICLKTKVTVQQQCISV